MTFKILRILIPSYQLEKNQKLQKNLMKLGQSSDEFKEQTEEYSTKAKSLILMKMKKLGIWTSQTF